jgi:spermidine synthase
MRKIAAIASDDGEVTILRSRSSGAVLYYQGLCNQSEADTQGVSLTAYVHAIFGLLLQADCNDVLMIGCGGGTLATMLRMAGVKVTIVDINSHSFQIARDYFQLPGEVECHVADGAEFLRTRPHRYGAIVLDAYQGGEMPQHLATAEFFRLVALRLVKGTGCFLANVCVNEYIGQTADWFAAAMMPALRNVRILDAKPSGNSNAIVMAGAVKDLQRPILLLPPEFKAREVAHSLDLLTLRKPHSAKPDKPGTPRLISRRD